MGEGLWLLPCRARRSVLPERYARTLLARVPALIAMAEDRKSLEVWVDSAYSLYLGDWLAGLQTGCRRFAPVVLTNGRHRGQKNDRVVSRIYPHYY